MEDEFGAVYSGSLARDHVLGALKDRTALVALADGVRRGRLRIGHGAGR